MPFRAYFRLFIEIVSQHYLHSHIWYKFSVFRMRLSFIFFLFFFFSYVEGMFVYFNFPKILFTTEVQDLCGFVCNVPVVNKFFFIYVKELFMFTVFACTLVPKETMRRHRHIQCFIYTDNKKYHQQK